MEEAGDQPPTAHGYHWMMMMIMKQCILCGGHVNRPFRRRGESCAIVNVWDMDVSVIRK